MARYVCRGLCKGTDRPATESPAKLVPIGNHRQVLVCECCARGLVAERPTGDLVGERAPGLDPAVSRKGMRGFDDPTCGYRVDLLQEIREA